jgi:hypothetical protein
MYLCVRDIDFASISKKFQLDFGTALTVWYYLFNVRAVPKSRKTNNTTMLEQFQNLEKQIIPQC